jgi:hypothetical protein
MKIVSKKDALPPAKTGAGHGSPYLKDIVNTLQTMKPGKVLELPLAESPYTTIKALRLAITGLVSKSRMVDEDGCAYLVGRYRVYMTKDRAHVNVERVE